MRAAYSIDTLASENTRVGDHWRVTVYASTQPYGVEFANSANAATAEIFILNSAPTVFDQELLALPGDDLAITLQVTDPDEQPHSFTPLSPPALGSIHEFDADAGTLIYRPDSSAVGSDSFTFKATDSAGADSNDGQIRIQVGGWFLPIDVTGAQIDSIGIGQHPEASGDFDDGLDSLAPPGTRGNGAVWLGSQLARDIQPEGDSVWTLEIVTGEGPVTIEWDTARVPEHSFIIGDDFQLDMQVDNRLEFSSDTTLTIRHGSVTFDLHLDSGWNLISTPIEPEDPDLFGDGLFTWAGGEIVPADSFEPKRGYYYHNPGPPTTTTIIGTPVPDDGTFLSYGWNFCGAVSTPPYAPRPYADVLQTPHHLPIWGYDGGYRASDYFEAGKAYFVWSSIQLIEK